ncbi:hypothetical protein TAMA11512_18880 [Selenomonas sp. TAMA-11512]|nr:hypothetical protein TAMA11512_18880 [Selenomonas sp. TAMA-11512]
MRILKNLIRKLCKFGRVHTVRERNGRLCCPPAANGKEYGAEEGEKFFYRQRPFFVQKISALYMFDLYVRCVETFSCLRMKPL